MSEEIPALILPEQEEKEEPYEWWACPDCGFDRSGEEGFYYFNGKKLIDCTEYHEKSGNIFAKSPKGEKAYPVYGDSSFNVAASMDHGGNPYDWKETHFCPNCKKEYSYENSNY